MSAVAHLQGATIIGRLARKSVTMQPPVGPVLGEGVAPMLLHEVLLLPRNSTIDFDLALV